MRKSFKKSALKPANRQISKIKKRDALQVKLCNQIFKLANNLEKQKLVEEKKAKRKQRERISKDKRKKKQVLE